MVIFSHYNQRLQLDLALEPGTVQNLLTDENYKKADAVTLATLNTPKTTFKYIAPSKT